jgi:hypothetical protein
MTTDEYRFTRIETAILIQPGLFDFLSVKSVFICGCSYLFVSFDDEPALRET